MHVAIMFAYYKGQSSPHALVFHTAENFAFADRLKQSTVHFYFMPCF